MGDAKAADWLREHLCYEFRMLRHAYGKICELPEGGDWNACYEAFIVHARNLYDFLLNDGGANNFKASDFTEFLPDEQRHRPDGRLYRLNSQVFHMGKTRPAHGDKKINLEDCGVVIAWIEKERLRFARSLTGIFANAWAEEMGGPAEKTTDWLKMIPHGQLSMTTGSAKITSTQLFKNAVRAKTGEGEPT